MIMQNINTFSYKINTTIRKESISELETALASYLGYQEVITLESTQSAFSLALSVFDSSGSVLCSPNAPLSFFNALHDRGLEADYCDLKLDGTMETRFFHKTKRDQSSALLLSHNHGILSDVEKAHLFAQENNLSYIEDATQAFDPRDKSGAKMVVYDLDALLPASLAKGAFIATDDEVLAASLRLKAGDGFEPKKFWNYDVVNRQEELTLSPLVAKIALEQLKEFDQNSKRMAELQKLYLQRLSSNKLIELPNAQDLAPYSLFQIALVPALFCPKEDIYQALIEAGIPVKVGNKPIYKTTAFKNDALSLFGAEEIFKAQLLLPSHHLMQDADVDYVIETLEKVLETYGYRGCSF